MDLHRGGFGGSLHQHAIVVLLIHLQGESKLLHVGQTRSLTGFVTGLGEHTEEDSRENRDNGDNNEKLDEGERLACYRGSLECTCACPERLGILSLSTKLIVMNSRRP